MDYMTMNFNRNGGGGGTTNYNQLTNKPSINDVTLSGNKTASDLGLMPTYEVDTTPTEDSDNLITSGGVWTADKNINNKLQGSKTAGSTDGSPFEIPDYGMTESIQMYFKPTQDLHGYDKPWAGGAGKNKLPSFEAGTKTDNDITVVSDGNGIMHISGTSSAEAIILFDLDESYTIPRSIGQGGNGCFYMFNTDVVLGCYLVFYDGSSQVDRWETDRVNRANGGYSNMGERTINKIGVRVSSGVSVDMYIAPMITDDGSEAGTTFEPYSNICPISGQDNATFSWTDNHDIENEASMDFGQTYYGGFCQFATGAIYSEWDYIANYNGETLSGEWVSDRDEYVAGTTPTIGAEVAYKTTPSYVRVTPPANLNLTDDYPIEYNGYMASIYYQPKNTVLAGAKRYTNQEIAKLGLPQAPTTDGTYHLECSVSGGIPTIRWVSNS